MPVHHIGGDRGHVFAYVDELETWLQSRDSSSDPKIDWQDHVFPAPLPNDRASISGTSFLTAERQRSAEFVDLALKKWKNVSSDNLQPIARLLRMAVDLDPFSVPALAYSAAVMIAQGLWGDQPGSISYRSVTAVLRQADELNSSFVLTRILAGWLHLVVDRNWSAARRLFEETLQTAPRNPIAQTGLAMLHIVEAKPGQAADIYATVIEGLPLNAFVMGQSAWVDYLAEDYERAIAKITHARRGGCSGRSFDVVEALSLLQIGDSARAIEHIEELYRSSSHGPVLTGALGRAYSISGFVGKASEILETLTKDAAPGMNNKSYAAALIYTGLGESQKAVEALEACFRGGSVWSLAFHCDPAFSPLREEPNFRRLLDRINYPVHG
jgi:tetratricopeptide (TPR) repeat protein